MTEPSSIKFHCEELRIYLSPSFQYTFCLYSLPDLRVGNDRFRLVVEVRVRPGAYEEHGDHYKLLGDGRPHVQVVGEVSSDGQLAVKLIRIEKG